MLKSINTDTRSICNYNNMIPCQGRQPYQLLRKNRHSRSFDTNTYNHKKLQYVQWRRPMQDYVKGLNFITILSFPFIFRSFLPFDPLPIRSFLFILIRSPFHPFHAFPFLRSPFHRPHPHAAESSDEVIYPQTPG